MCDGGGMAAAAVLDTNPRWRQLTDEEVESVAAFAHEANRIYRRSIGEDAGDAWLRASDEQRASVREGVLRILGDGMKIPYKGVSLEEESHNRWMERKLREGWRFGVLKNEAEKTHPCLLPYHALAPVQRRKDHLFRAICVALDPRLEV